MLRLHEIIIEMIITTVKTTPSDTIMIRCIITYFSSGDHSFKRNLKTNSRLIKNFQIIA
jgi:hypothetical protein